MLDIRGTKSMVVEFFIINVCICEVLNNAFFLIGGADDTENCGSFA